MTPQSKELDKPQAAPLSLEQVEEVLLHGGELAVISADEVQDDMVRRILESENIEGAFGQFTSTPANDLEGQKLTIKGIAWMRSSFDEGPKVYALLDAELTDSGEPLTVSMGGRTTMAAFVWAQRNAAMPFQGVFRKERSRNNPERSFWTFKLA